MAQVPCKRVAGGSENRAKLLCFSLVFYTFVPYISLYLPIGLVSWLGPLSGASWGHLGPSWAHLGDLLG